MKIGIIGGGVVGRATARAFVEHAEVRIYDTVAERRTHTQCDVIACDIVFVCLPTPQLPNSMEADLSALDAFFSQLLHAERGGYFVLKSTVPIGTTTRLRRDHELPNLVHSPEFLTERCALVDACMPARNIVGGPPCAGLAIVADLYKKRFPGIPVHVMRSAESEAVKLIVNSFFAVKVAFFNEAHRMVQALDLDWERVLNGVLSDGRIAQAHTKVPGPDGKYGFGGACLPKDLADFIEVTEKAGESAAVCRAAYHRNTEDRKQ
jgi:UDPglucose 6-dehydrogenase